MKKVEAIIRTSKFEEVKTELKKIGIDFFSYWEASGVGNEITRGHMSYRGTIYDTQFIPRYVISIVLRDLNLQKTIDCIQKTAYTGEVGDGMIFVTTIEQSVRISNGKTGDDSLLGPGDAK